MNSVAEIKENLAKIQTICENLVDYCDTCNMSSTNVSKDFLVSVESLCGDTRAMLRAVEVLQE